MNDFIKAPIILFGYFVFAPLLGALIQGSRQAQSWIFALMVFMTSWHINKFTLMLGSIEKYRGHTKGFEFSLLEMLAIALIVAAILGKKTGDKTWRWLPPGLLLYLLYCAASWLSLFAAPEKTYVLMAGIRFTKIVLVFAGTFFFIREEKDVHLLLKALAVTMIVQAVVVLKMKYVDGFYQVRGWFEHQNPLAMWAYLCGLPLFAAGMSDVPKAETKWYFAGFVASAIIVQSSLSRAALAAFAVGVVLVVLLSFADKISPKRVISVVCLGVIGALGLVMAFGTIVGRFNDEGNEASGETRVVMNLASKAMLDDSSIGIGWNNFALTINAPFPYGDVIDDREREKGRPVDEEYAKGVVESHYWLLLAETGYGGLITYLLFITVTAGWCLLGMWRWRRQFLAAFLCGLLVAMALTYLHSSLERVLTQTKNMATWMILLGAAARIETWRRAAIGKRRGARANAESQCRIDA